MISEKRFNFNIKFKTQGKRMKFIFSQKSVAGKANILILFIKKNLFLHIYIHSFRFAQGTKRNEKGLASSEYFFIISHRGFGILQITGR